MALDRMRIVEMRNFTPFPVLDLNDGTNYTHIANQFQPIRPTKARATIGGARRYDGDAVAFEKMGNANLSTQWLIGPPGTTQDASMRNLEYMGQAFEDATRLGRLIEVRLQGETKSVFYEPRGTPDWSLQTYNASQVAANAVLQATASIPVAPLAYGLPMDVEDHFLTDSIANGDWNQDAGAGNLTRVGPYLVPGALTRSRYRRNSGYIYRDCEVRLTVLTGGSVTNGRWGIFISGNQSGIDTKLALELDAATGQAQLVTYFAGTRTVVQNFAVTVSANSTYYMRLLRMGDVIRALVQIDSATSTTPVFQPDDYTTTFYHSPWLLTGAQLGLQGGDCGVDITPASTGERYTDFYIRPFSNYSVATPEVIHICNVPGTAPAAMDVEITTNDTGAVGQPPVWALLGWSEKPKIYNLCQNGSFENANDATPWSRLALTNYVTNAATSAAIDSLASRYGGSELNVVTPASTQSGVSLTINRRLKLNVQYAAFAWAKATSASPPTAALKLGAIGVGGVSIGVAKTLTTQWQLFSTTYRQTGLTDYDGIVVAFATQAATATTFQLDGVCVVEVPTITLSGTITAGQTTLPVYFNPAELPNTRPDGGAFVPFLFMVDSELMLCTGISGTTWTVTRGAENTSAQAHAVDSPVIICPMTRPQLEGKGANPPIGIIEGESYAQDVSGVTSGSGSIAISADTTARGQQTALFTGTSNPTVAAFYYYLDPSLIVQDDFTQGEVDVEIMARFGLTQTVAVNVLTTVEPSERYSGLVLAGRRRLTREFGSTTKGIVLPASAGEKRLVRLGTVPMIVDPRDPQRWRLKILVQILGSTNMSIDYLMVTPIRYRACLPTGRADDGGATYPSFLPFDANWGTGSAMTKIFHADGSAAIRNPIPSSGRYNSLPPAYPDHGFGKQLQIPVGDCDLYFKLSDTIPDDPTSNNASDMSGGASSSWQCTKRAIVWPRYYVGRGGA